MANVSWTPAAENDLDEIFLFIGRERQSPLAAARVIREIVAKAKLYSKQPLMASVRPEFGFSARSFFVLRYVVIYRPKGNGIEVIRIIHAARDVFRVLPPEQG